MCTLLEKYEEDFFQCVNAKFRLRTLLRKGVITDTIKGEIENADDDDSREILFDHLKRNASIDTLKRYLEVATAADAYPKMQTLGGKMREELQQGGWLEVCAGVGGTYMYVCTCVYLFSLGSCVWGGLQVDLHVCVPECVYLSLNPLTNLAKEQGCVIMWTRFVQEIMNGSQWTCCMQVCA